MFWEIFAVLFYLLVWFGCILEGRERHGRFILADVIIAFFWPIGIGYKLSE